MSPQKPSKIRPIFDLMPVIRANWPSTQSKILAKINNKNPNRLINRLLSG